MQKIRKTRPGIHKSNWEPVVNLYVVTAQVHNILPAGRGADRGVTKVYQVRFVPVSQGVWCNGRIAVFSECMSGFNCFNGECCTIVYDKWWHAL